MFLIASIVGGIIGMVFLSILVSFVGFKSLEPIKRAVATAMTAFLIGVVVYGSQDGGRYLEACMIYLPGAIVAFLERRRHYEKHWNTDEEITDVFK